MQKDTEHELYFKWPVEELKLKGTLCEKTIIYCQTIKTRVQNVCECELHDKNAFF